jgi:SagB-type dehydrogenase family enzyme
MRVLGAALLAALGLLAGIPHVYAFFSRRRRVKPGGWKRSGERILLPLPRLEGDVSLERALANRRSIRDYTREPLRLEEVSQVLWAAYGITETRYGFKTTPSAGATYPLEVYLVAYPEGVLLPDGGFLEPGSYHYDPHSHSITLVKRGDLSRALYEAALEQEWVLEARACIVIAAVYERTTRRYGQRGVRYVHMEVGHAGQNIYLQATALGLATVAIGAFYDEDVKRVVGLGPSEEPLYLMPLARPLRPYYLDESDLMSYIDAYRG